MPVTYTNRKGRTYYLHQDNTKTGKIRYTFKAHKEGQLIESIPAGFAIRESVNGVVSLIKDRPILITQSEALC